MDETGHKLYWTDIGTRKIQRANVDGTNVEDLVTTGLIDPNGIALNVAGGKMYWADVQEIWRADLDGTNVEALITSGLGRPVGLAFSRATPTTSPCVGDCDTDHSVAVNEIITLVNMTLGTQTQLSACLNGIPPNITDISQINVALIIQAVNNALNRCPLS